MYKGRLYMGSVYTMFALSTEGDYNIAVSMVSDMVEKPADAAPLCITGIELIAASFNAHTPPGMKVAIVQAANTPVRQAGIKPITDYFSDCLRTAMNDDEGTLTGEKVNAFVKTRLLFDCVQFASIVAVEYYHKLISGPKIAYWAPYQPYN